MAVTIRTLTIDDYDTMLSIWENSGLKIHKTGRESRESFARQMTAGLQTVLGAEADGRLVGVAVITHDGRKGWINRLGVARDYQRQGIGRMLIRAAEDLLHQKGLTVMAALVEHGNEASLSLFQSEGYHLNDDVYYLSKRDHPDA